MSRHTENQSWLVKRGGDVVKKMAAGGVASLNDWERLLYCVWVTDYMLRNAGDFANAPVMYPDFQKDAARFAKTLGLKLTFELFSLSQLKLQRDYFDRFEAICDEIKRAESGTIRGLDLPDSTGRN